jgi:hypothetical protein
MHTQLQKFHRGPCQYEGALKSLEADPTYCCACQPRRTGWRTDRSSVKRPESLSSAHRDAHEPLQSSHGMVKGSRNMFGDLLDQFVSLALQARTDLIVTSPTALSPLYP